MKSPISLLTFSSLSVSACLLAEYLSSSEAVISAFPSLVGKAVFLCAFRLSSLLFGVFLYFRNTENRAEGLQGYAHSYFSVFSLVLIAVIPVLAISHGAYIFSAFFSAVLVLFISLLLSASPSQHIAATACGVPMLIFAATGCAVSVGGIFCGW